MLILARILATLFAILVVARSFTDYRNKKESLVMTLFWVLVWLVILSFAYYPTLVDLSIKILGGSRTGLGTVFGMGMIFVLFISYRIYLKANRVEKQMELVIRELALNDLDGGANLKIKADNQPNRIAIFTPYFLPHSGGVERYVYEISKRFVKIGKEVAIITSKFANEKRIEEINGVKVYRLSSWDIIGGWPYPKIKASNKRLIKKVLSPNPDLIISNTRFFYHSFLAYRIAKSRGIKFVHIEHGSNFPELGSRLKNLVAKTYDLTVGKYVIGGASTVIAISESAAKFAKSLGAKKTVVIPNSVDTDFFAPEQNERKTVVVTFVGRLIPSKRVEDLIEAVKGINDPPILNIVGAGPQTNNLKALAKDYDNIFFYGEQDEDFIKNILSRSDIFVNPSVSEGLPTTILEAASCALAIIATNAGGTTEIIHDRENGLIVPAKDPEAIRGAIEFLSASKNLRQMLGAAARKTVLEKFSWQANLIKLQELIGK